MRRFEGTLSFALLVLASACGNDDSSVASPGSGGTSQTSDAGQNDAGGAAGASQRTDEFAQACAAVRAWKLACTSDTAEADAIEQSCLAAKPCADAIYIEGAAKAVLDCIAQSSCAQPGDVGSTCFDAANAVQTVETKKAHDDFVAQCSGGVESCKQSPVDPADDLDVYMCVIPPIYKQTYYAALASCVSNCTTAGIRSCAEQKLAEQAPGCVSGGWVFGSDLPYPEPY